MSKRFNICHAYGLIWHGFKIKVGCAYGTTPDGTRWVCPSVSPFTSTNDILYHYVLSSSGEWTPVSEYSDLTRSIVLQCQKRGINVSCVTRHYSNPNHGLDTCTPQERKPQVYQYKTTSIRQVDHGQQSQGGTEFFGMDGYNGWMGYH